MITKHQTDTEDKTKTVIQELAELGIKATMENGAPIVDITDSTSK